jgi:tetratricopeptide (TPR) repeat protein
MRGSHVVRLLSRQAAPRRQFGARKKASWIVHKSASVVIGAVVLALAMLGIARAQPAGNPGAPPRLTLCDVTPNIANMVRWCQEAIRTYPEVARFHEHLGRAYLFVHRYGEAQRSLEKAAELGSAGAMRDLGVLYERGSGVPQDFAEAKKWYQKAGVLGDSHAAFRLGVIYEQGLGAVKSLADAVTWYRKAAQLGSLDAERALSRLSPGEGSPE